jgi:hypothetical protein
MSAYPEGFWDWPEEKRNAFFKAEATSFEVREKAKATGNGGNKGALPPKAETFLIKASEIKPEPISWLWKYWLARAKLHIVAGAPGGGKSTSCYSFAATHSSGATWPDGTRAKVGNILIWTSEDGLADTVRV